MIKKIENFIKKFLLKLLVIKPNRNNNIVEINDFRNKKVLFIRLNRIGDALVTTPLISLLKSKLNLTTHVLADKKNFFVFSNQSFVDKTIVFNKGLSGYKKFKELLNKEKYDVVVDLHDDTSTTVSILLSFVTNSYVFGLKKNNLELYTKTVEKLDSTKFHVVERIAKIAELFNVNHTTDELNIRYDYTKDDITHVTEFLEQAFNSNKPLIGINIIAGNKSRFWGINRFSKLINLIKNFDVNIVIITTPNEIKTAHEISKGKIPIYYSNKFTRISALVSKLNFLFTPDTSIVHLASIYSVPVFGLYVKYNTNDIIWYAYKSPHDEVVTLEENFENLTFEQIENQFKHFFEKMIYGK